MSSSFFVQKGANTPCMHISISAAGTHPTCLDLRELWGHLQPVSALKKIVALLAPVEHLLLVNSSEQAPCKCDSRLADRTKTSSTFQTCLGRTWPSTLQRIALPLCITRVLQSGDLSSTVGTCSSSDSQKPSKESENICKFIAVRVQWRSLQHDQSQEKFE